MDVYAEPHVWLAAPNVCAADGEGKIVPIRELTSGADAIELSVWKQGIGLRRVGSETPLLRAWLSKAFDEKVLAVGWIDTRGPKAVLNATRDRRDREDMCSVAEMMWAG
jgi:hypothetical protein